MGHYTVRHAHYSRHEHFEELVKDLIVSLVRHHADRGLKNVPPGQYLVLHRVGRGVHVPLLVHVRRGYSGHEAYVHPLPLDRDVSRGLKTLGVHTPYGTRALEYLFLVLRDGRHVESVRGAEYMLGRLGTARSRITYPPLPEYASGYEANKLLQEVEHGGEYVLDYGKVFVGRYRRGEGWRLERFDPKTHEVGRLVTVWAERPESFPVAHVGSDVYAELRRRALKGRGVQTHFP